MQLIFWIRLAHDTTISIKKLEKYESAKKVNQAGTVFD
jgi:hypothetical protein